MKEESAMIPTIMSRVEQKKDRPTRKQLKLTLTRIENILYRCRSRRDSDALNIVIICLKEEIKRLDSTTPELPKT